MKEIKTFIWLKIDNKDILLISKNYKGSPMVCCKYDILIGPKQTILKFKKELFPTFYKNHKIQVKYLED